MAATYLDWLRTKEKTIKPRIDALLRDYKAQEVGNGYIDLILPLEHATELIDKLTFESIAVEAISWWCHCTPESQQTLGCPHGMGGPRSRYFEGWFSELGEVVPTLELLSEPAKLDVKNLFHEVQSINDEAKKHLSECQNVAWYSPCLFPALWLCVPKEWRQPS